ncbi:MAG: universal stress protein [Lentisphaeraceae bacterium]|nr:universal stress protein [Lentisphaeraceae bacterium]
MNKILLGINFQNESDAAIEDAFLLASKYDAQIIPIHAIEYLPRRNEQHETDLLVRQIEKRMKTIEERLSVRGIDVLKTIIEKGDPISVISSAATVLEVDLLIIGAGVNDLKHRTLGVTAKQLVRTSPVPIWISNCATNKVDYDNIVCAVDLSERALTTLNNAASLARILGAKLHIVHVEPKMSYYPGLMNSDIPVSPWTLSEFVTKMPDNEASDKAHRNHVLTHDFKEFIEKANLDSLECDIHIKSGKASKEILNFVDEFQAGLLVLGTLGKTNIIKKLLGGTIEKILDRLPCTMLAIPHPED